MLNTICIRMNEFLASNCSSAICVCMGKLKEEWIGNGSTSHDLLTSTFYLVYGIPSISSVLRITLESTVKLTPVLHCRVNLVHYIES